MNIKDKIKEKYGYIVSCNDCIYNDKKCYLSQYNIICEDLNKFVPKIPQK